MICFKDVIKLATTEVNGYGDQSVDYLTDLDCLFLQSTGDTFGDHQEQITSDAHAYIDFNNPVVSSLGYRLEGMFVIAQPFGTSEQESWYKIIRVVVGQRKLLCNDVDNVHIFLKKTEALS